MNDENQLCTRNHVKVKRRGLYMQLSPCLIVRPGRDSQCFLVYPPSGNMVGNKQCFLVCPPSGNMAKEIMFRTNRQKHLPAQIIFETE